MKKQFMEPVIKITRFEVMDIITTSTTQPEPDYDEDELPFVPAF